MNNKKNYDLKLIKQKLNAAMVLITVSIEEIEDLAEDFPQIETSHLVEALDKLEVQYWEIEDLKDVQD